MASYHHLVWLLCVHILIITEVQGKSIRTNNLQKDSIKTSCGEKDYGVSISNLISRVRRAAVVDNHWNVTTLTYKVMNGPFRSPLHKRRLSLLSKTRVKKLVAKAFAEWSPHCGLHFKEWNPRTGGRPDIMLSFERLGHGDRDDFDGPCNVLAHADYPYQKGSDVHFDSDEIWVDRKTTSKEEHACIASFYPIALHEIGHALGLKHSDDENSIMYGSENSAVQSLSKSDIMNMRKLYGINKRTPTSRTHIMSLRKHYGRNEYTPSRNHIISIQHYGRYKRTQ